MQGRLVYSQGKNQRWCVVEGPVRFEFVVEVVGSIIVPVGGGLCVNEQHSEGSDLDKEVPPKIAETYQQYFHSRT